MKVRALLDIGYMFNVYPRSLVTSRQKCDNFLNGHSPVVQLPSAYPFSVWSFILIVL